MLSHRSHALGNPQANILPSCQLESLSRLSSTIDPEISALWIDTLLVPLIQPLRQRTISSMGTIYRNSKAMIVVDRDLLSVKGPRTHRALQIWLSDWMTRLWTLQEGWMCLHKIHFAFQDRLVPIYELTQGLYHLNPLREILAGPYHPVVIGTSLHFDPGEGSTGDITKFAASLQRRHTSKWWDEAICLATLLGHEVLALPYRPKLEDLLKLMSSSIPMEVMFLNGPRSDLEGFRWAPKTLLSTRTNPSGSLAPSTSTILGPKGIRIVKNIIRFDTSISIKQGRRPLLMVRLEAAPGALCVVTLAEDDGIDEMIEARVLHNAALVFEVRPESVTEALGVSAMTNLQLEAVLVSHLREDDEHEMCARYATATTVAFDETVMGSYFAGFPTVSGSPAADFALWVD